MTVPVELLPVDLDGLEQEIAAATVGKWWIRVSAPWLAALVSGYRESLAWHEREAALLVERDELQRELRRCQASGDDRG